MVFKLFFIRTGIRHPGVAGTRRRPVKSYLENREKARDLVTGRLNYFNTFYGYKWNRIAIKNTKRRWGSCSKKGNLNFCYKIVFLPTEIADYVIVHELCHLGQFNHSKMFWELVSRTLPDFRMTRKKLMDGSGKLF